MSWFFLCFLAINYWYHVTCNLAVVNELPVYEIIQKIRCLQFYIIAVWHNITELRTPESTVLTLACISSFSCCFPVTLASITSSLFSYSFSNTNSSNSVTCLLKQMILLKHCPFHFIFYTTYSTIWKTLLYCFSLPQVCILHHNIQLEFVMS